MLLLSGGLDSATAGAIARADGFELFALSVQYGQRHQWELAASQRVAEHLRVREHQIVDVDLGGMGGSAPSSRNPAATGSKSSDFFRSAVRTG